MVVTVGWPEVATLPERSLKVPTKMFRRHTVESSLLFGLANSAWCATMTDSTDGVTFETALLVLCAVAAGSLLIRLRKAHAQLRAQSGTAGALTQELEGVRAMLGLSHMRHVKRTKVGTFAAVKLQLSGGKANLRATTTFQSMR
jgi:hypothetical protein